MDRDRLKKLAKAAEADRARRKTAAGRLAAQKKTAKWDAANPEKARARADLHNALRRGVIKRGVCEKCGAKKTDGHHDNYKKPLEVRWLCRLHHKELHRKLKEAAK